MNRKQEEEMIEHYESLWEQLNQEQKEEWRNTGKVKDL